ncbi:NAD(P)/FAD-dependent oxidoreductase [Aliiroseovarius sp. S1123]|jgi:predicted Rossmann fold flavoprotein|uniref:NAD(P)/FAD-dependent oxidoreductase n=1 Tax=unclassified Aliiroseovarius TaxID=2623558 RepID=UPI001FF5D4DA|nr:NAD(P)/FAD-dependent oxidoreductase [Aliiroseovarius sp. S1123]MCK0170686.1 NAD(P)/FAD-dependent oxidoreductase [Aliiroseovarius sp. S1123]
MKTEWHTIIIGAGAAGLFAAPFAAKAGPTLVIDHAKKPGEKIRISGGGRCNFTNMYAEPKNFVGQNPHFHKSALARFSQWDFVELVDQAGIAWHEKTLGQLFCDGKSTQIVQMLTDRLAKAGAELALNTSVSAVAKAEGGFQLETSQGQLTCQNLIIATGGKSIPKMGATGFAYDIARQFGHQIIDTSAGLVPFTFPDGRFAALSGVSLPVRVWNDRASFEEALLFTHRGLSGPAILQISSYWQPGEPVHIDLTQGLNLREVLRTQRQTEGRRQLSTELSRHLPGKLVDHLATEWADRFDLTQRLADQSDTALDALLGQLSDWQLTPSGTEGYRTAEVTLGGVSTDALDSKSMMSKTIPGLYFIGECVDVTGWLGGFNFQWAWASAHAAGRHIAEA